MGKIRAIFRLIVRRIGVIICKVRIIAPDIRALADLNVYAQVDLCSLFAIGCGEYSVGSPDAPQLGIPRNVNAFWPLIRRYYPMPCTICILGARFLGAATQISSAECTVTR